MNIGASEIRKLRHAANEIVILSERLYAPTEPTDGPKSLQIHRNLANEVFAIADELESKLHI